MISIITCSRNDARYHDLAANYRARLGDVEHDLIRVPDAASICEGYNRGVAQSRGDTLIFSHDDAELLSNDWVRRTAEHLKEFDIVGVAGTTRLVGAAWIMAGPPHIHGHVAHADRSPPAPVGGPPQPQVAPYRLMIYGTTAPVIPDVQALDGCWIACRRSVMDQISFDQATFDAFHHYDLDFTYSAYRCGLKLAVACDILVMHYSGGKFDQSWDHSAERFMAKHGATLPPNPQRGFQFGAVGFATREELIEAMTPPVWRKPQT